jgi:hypothetical protein
VNSRITLVQGLYFFLTGVWPLVSIRTFQWVTGPKKDLWLVKTVGVMVAVIGGGLLCAQASGDYGSPVLVIGLGSAAGLAVIDIVYVAKRAISPIYLLDTVIEIGLLVWCPVVGVARLFSGDGL